MSMKKFTKKMLAIVAAAAMTMGMAMPAMAAEGTTVNQEIRLDERCTYQQDRSKDLRKLSARSEQLRHEIGRASCRERV